MSEETLAKIIQRTVEASSNGGSPDYSVLAGLIILMIAVFIIVTKYMGTQIIKHQQDSSKRQEVLLKTTSDNVGQQGVDLARHDERISTNEKQISGHKASIIKLFETKADKA